MIDRRQLITRTLLGAGAIALPHVVLAEALTERRFIFIVQRGGADGLATVMPVGDPHFTAARGADAGIRLDPMFALHPALSEIGALYRNREALFVHAVGARQQDRSHIGGQARLDRSIDGSGWLDRFSTLQGSPGRSVALSASLVGTAATAAGLRAAQLLTGPGSAQIATIATGGWDTHVGQAAQLATQLRGLDRLVAALRTGLGPSWRSTVVLVATEFGRSVALNDAGGTDHGAASVAMVFGGAVAGGRVVTDWPGLAPSARVEGRDLRATLALDTLIAATLAQHHALDPANVATTLFPDTPPPQFAGSLVRS